jgi:hypothetical protein
MRWAILGTGVGALLAGLFALFALGDALRGRTDLVDPA